MKDLIIYTIIALLICVVIFYQYKKYSQNKTDFLKRFNDFNKSRINKVGIEFYTKIDEFIYSTRIIFGVPFNLKDFSNPVDGKTLINNKSKIAEEFKFNKKSKDQNFPCIFSSLMYQFDSHEDFSSFVLDFTEALPDCQSYIFPINKTWVILGKNDKGMSYISVDKAIVNSFEKP